VNVEARKKQKERERKLKKALEAKQKADEAYQELLRQM